MCFGYLAKIRSSNSQNSKHDLQDCMFSSLEPVNMMSYHSRDYVMLYGSLSIKIMYFFCIRLIQSHKPLAVESFLQLGSRGRQRDLKQEQDLLYYRWRLDGEGHMRKNTGNFRK